MRNQKETTDFDRMVAELQREIIEQEQAVYSDRVIEEAHNFTNAVAARAGDLVSRGYH